MKLLPLFLACVSVPVLTASIAQADPAPAIPAPVAPTDAAPPAPVAPAEPAPTTPVAPEAPAVAAGPTLDPAAVAALDQSAKAYAALTGLAMHFSTFDKEGGKVTTSSGDVAFAGPDKARLQFKVGVKNLLFVSDGTKIVMQTRPEEYMAQPAQGAGGLQTVLQRVPSALGLILPAMASGTSPLSIRQIPWQKAEVIADGVSLTAFAGPQKTPFIFRLYFDPTDHLLRRVEAEIMLQGKKSLNITTLSALQQNADVPANTFVFAPAEGAKLVKQPSYYDPKLKVGSKPYPLVGRDLAGNQYPWSRYAGKVVLLDFWATWCGPCVGEIPNVLQNYQKYQAAGFRVLGVSLDESKSDLQNFIKARKLPYPSLFDGQGWQSPDAERYEVQGIPFSLLIGKDGKIAAVNPRGPALAPAIQKALKAK